MSEGYAMRMAMEMARNMQEAMTGAFFAPGAGTQFVCTQGVAIGGKVIKGQSYFKRAQRYIRLHMLLSAFE